MGGLDSPLGALQGVGSESLRGPEKGYVCQCHKGMRDGAILKAVVNESV